MKKLVFLLVMLLMTATTFSQTSRRTANTTKSVRGDNNKETKQEVNSRRGNNERTSVRSNKTSSSTAARRNTSSQQTSKSYNRNTGTHNTYSSKPEDRKYNRTATRHADVNKINNSQTTHSYKNNEARSNNHRVNRGTTYVSYYKSPRVCTEHRVVKYHYHHPPKSRYYRAKHYPYRVPVHVNILWTPAMRVEYINIYPMVKVWKYPVGYTIETISAYDATFYMGEVMNIYGKVFETFYSHKTDEYILYFGAYYPYHDFSVVIPGNIARRFSQWPEKYFEQQHVIVTGLITTYDEKPEVAVKRVGQVRVY